MAPHPEPQTWNLRTRTKTLPEPKGGKPDWAWSEVSEHQDGRRDPLAPVTAWSGQLKVSRVRVVPAWGAEGWACGPWLEGLDCSAFASRRVYEPRTCWKLDASCSFAPVKYAQMQVVGSQGIRDLLRTRMLGPWLPKSARQESCKVSARLSAPPPRSM